MLLNLRCVVPALESFYQTFQFALDDFIRLSNKGTVDNDVSVVFFNAEVMCYPLFNLLPFSFSDQFEVPIGVGDRVTNLS